MLQYRFCESISCMLHEVRIYDEQPLLIRKKRTLNLINLRPLLAHATCDFKFKHAVCSCCLLVVLHIPHFVRYCMIDRQQLIQFSRSRLREQTGACLLWMLLSPFPYGYAVRNNKIVRLGNCSVFRENLVVN